MWASIIIRAMLRIGVSAETVTGFAVISGRLLVLGNSLMSIICQSTSTELGGLHRGRSSDGSHGCCSRQAPGDRVHQDFTEPSACSVFRRNWQFPTELDGSTVSFPGQAS